MRGKIIASVMCIVLITIVLVFVFGMIIIPRMTEMELDGQSVSYETNASEDAINIMINSWIPLIIPIATATMLIGGIFGLLSPNTKNEVDYKFKVTDKRYCDYCRKEVKRTAESCPHCLHILPNAVKTGFKEKHKNIFEWLKRRNRV